MNNQHNKTDWEAPSFNSDDNLKNVSGGRNTWAGQTMYDGQKIGNVETNFRGRGGTVLIYNTHEVLITEFTVDG